MVAKAKARIFRRNDGKYLVYLAKSLCEDSQFPIKLTEENPSTTLEATFTETGLILDKKQ